MEFELKLPASHFLVTLDLRRQAHNMSDNEVKAHIHSIATEAYKCFELDLMTETALHELLVELSKRQNEFLLLRWQAEG